MIRGCSSSRDKTYNGNGADFRFGFVVKTARSFYLIISSNGDSEMEKVLICRSCIGFFHAKCCKNKSQLSDIEEFFSILLFFYFFFASEVNAVDGNHCRRAEPSSDV